jgi:hypothetical protein
MKLDDSVREGVMSPQRGGLLDRKGHEASFEQNLLFFFYILYIITLTLRV